MNIIIKKNIEKIKLFFFNLFSCKEFILRRSDTFQVLEIVRKYIPEDALILEAGAFNGNDTVKIANIFPRAKIFAFEPVPEIFDWLKKNTILFKNIFCYQLALGDKNDYVKFYKSYSKKKPDKPAAGSLLAPKEHLLFAPHVSFDQIVEVESITLDSWAIKNKVDHLDFLWLDMQGMEFNVIKNSPKIIQTVKVIYTEVEFIEAYKDQHQYKDVKNFLENQGFKMIARDFINNEIINPQKSRRWFGNVIFVRSNII